VELLNAMLTISSLNNVDYGLEEKRAMKVMME
jgi:hypothetical protein